MRAILLAVLGCVAAAGCGGDDGETCESVTSRICDLACACTEGAACWMYIEDPSGGDTVLPLADPDDCLEWGTTFCTEDSADAVDYAACGAALDSAGCVEIGGEMALDYPTECLPVEE